MIFTCQMRREARSSEKCENKNQRPIIPEWLPFVRVCVQAEKTSLACTLIKVIRIRTFCSRAVREYYKPLPHPCCYSSTTSHLFHTLSHTRTCSKQCIKRREMEKKGQRRTNCRTLSWRQPSSVSIQESIFDSFVSFYIDSIDSRINTPRSLQANLFFWACILVKENTDYYL